MKAFTLTIALTLLSGCVQVYHPRKTHPTTEDRIRAKVEEMDMATKDVIFYPVKQKS